MGAEPGPGRQVSFGSLIGSRHYRETSPDGEQSSLANIKASRLAYESIRLPSRLLSIAEGGHRREDGLQPAAVNGSTTMPQKAYAGMQIPAEQDQVSQTKAALTMVRLRSFTHRNSSLIVLHVP